MYNATAENAVKTELANGQLSEEQFLASKLELETRAAEDALALASQQKAAAAQDAALVVVVDDWDQGITQVIRGADLLTMTSRQQHLFRLLGAAAPDYGHLPLAVTAPGQKLSKQNHARPLQDWPLTQSMAAALTVLGHPPPAELAGAPVSELLAWALGNWQLRQVPQQLEVRCPDFA